MRKGDNLVLYSCMRDGVIVAKSIFRPTLISSMYSVIHTSSIQLYIYGYIESMFVLIRSLI